MSVPTAYLGVILIWSTTPLAVQWSTGSFSPLGALTARLCLAWILVAALSALLRTPVLGLAKHWKLYASASLGLFPNLALLNSAAQYIPSGLIAVMFGLSPFLVGILASGLLGEQRLRLPHYAALGLALSGLGLIFAEQVQLGDNAVRGIILMLLSVFLFSLSSVLVKRYTDGIPTLNQLHGSLIFAMPGVLFSWWLMDGALPDSITVRSGSAIVYLAVVGSLVGVWAYLYLLAHMRMGPVSVIPLITPGLALLVGAVLNDEAISLNLAVGALLIVAGLGLFNRVAVGSTRPLG